MITHAGHQNQTVRVVRRLARITGVGLLLFWGAFFIEHLSWFSDFGWPPPPGVWVLQAVHFLLLMGFIIALKWERAGSVLIIGSALLFLAPTSGKRFPLLFAITIVPALLYLFCWWNSRNSGTDGQSIKAI
jgi:hypothetical protein